MHSLFAILNTTFGVVMQFVSLFKNRYLITILAIFFWLVFFDKNDVFTQYELIQKCKKLNGEKEYYIQEISKNKTNLDELKLNKKSLETFSRETYLMKKENEDVFIFVAK